MKGKNITKTELTLLFISNRINKKIRSKLFCSSAYLMHLFYYRIIFNKIAPRLPLQRGSLW
ncbi:MAG: hypothetical protein HW406_1196 [Candidatus Brocadiaceae bacterium]|nr:hypothetical protein [Candidatus Brocadiaceae bacterium]